MQELFDLAKLIEQGGMGRFVREVPWLYPVLESLHILGIALLLGTTAAVDLRLLGAWRDRVAVRTLTGTLLPLARTGFALILVTGLAMFTGIALSVVRSDAAVWKFGLLALVLANVLVFHRGIFSDVARWDTGPTPVAARVAAVVSLVGWTGCLFAGRMLAYV